MRRQSLLLLTFLSLVVLLTACGDSAPATQERSECSLACEDETFLKDYLTKYFGLSADQYTIVCSECNTARGSHVAARLNVSGSLVDAYYRQGLCSSGGTDCGWYMSFTSYGPETDALYDSVKNSFCAKVTEDVIYNLPICKTAAQDNTTAVRAGCMGGAFEQVDGEQRTLAIDQINNRCNSYAQAGDFSPRI